jgi:hypothetical protein
MAGETMPELNNPIPGQLLSDCWPYLALPETSRRLGSRLPTGANVRWSSPSWKTLTSTTWLFSFGGPQGDIAERIYHRLTQAGEADPAVGHSGAGQADPEQVERLTAGFPAQAGAHHGEEEDGDGDDVAERIGQAEDRAQQAR